MQLHLFANIALSVHGTALTVTFTSKTFLSSSQEKKYICSVHAAVLLQYLTFGVAHF